MTPIELHCPKCGKTLRIETDDQAFLNKKKAEFEKKHEMCKHPAK